MIRNLPYRSNLLYKFDIFNGPKFASNINCVSTFLYTQNSALEANGTVHDQICRKIVHNWKWLVVTSWMIFIASQMLQYTPNNIYWILGTKNNAYKHQNILFSSIPKNNGKIIKKKQHQVQLYPINTSKIKQIKNINNNIFCSSLWVLSKGYLRRIRRCKSGRKRRMTQNNTTHEIIVYERSKTANADVFFFRKLVFMVL